MHIKLQQRCNPLWDTYLDWPSAALNETIELPCPDQELQNQTARRTCILRACNLGVSRPVWTVADYSRCPDPDKYSTLFIKIAQEKYEELKDKMWEYKLLYLSQISYFQSLIVVVVALSIFVLFRKLRNARTRLHMHMLSSVMLQAVMWLLHSFLFDAQLLNGHMYLQVLHDIDIDIAPKVAADFSNIAEQMFTRFNGYLSYIIIAGLDRFFETATFFWLLMEGWFLYELICRKPLETQTSIKRYVIIGWGLPMIITTPWMISHIYSSFNDVYWVKHDTTVIFIALSVFVTFIVNFYFFVKISHVLYVKMKTSLELQQKTKMEYKKWARSTFTLVLLFGLQNLLYCSWFYVDKTKPKIIYLQSIKIMSSFQGCFVSFIYCFLNDDVQSMVKENIFSTKKKTNRHSNRSSKY